MRQCPKCKYISEFTSPSCARCGLQFLEVPKTRWRNMTADCLRIGGGAILLAAAAAIVLRLT